MVGEAFSIRGVVDVNTGPLRAGIREASGLVTGFGHSVLAAGTAVASAFAGAAVAGIAAAGAGLGVAVKQAADFEKTLSAVKAVSGATAAEMKTLQKLALDLGAATSFSATESAQGIEELVKAGVSIADIMSGAAKASLDLAAAGGIKVADAATLAAQAMNAFSIKGADMGKVANTIAGAANASAIDVGQFKFSLQAAGAVAATVGFSFDDLAQAIAVMGQAGIVGSDAGTSIKTMLMGLQPQTDKQRQLFRELNLTLKDGSNAFFDSTGKVKSMAEVAQILQDALKGQTQQQKLATLETLFGSDAIRAAAVFSKAGAAGFREMAAAMGKVTAADVANTRLDNLSGSLEKLRGSLSTVAITIGLGLTPGIRRLVDMATESVNAWLPAISVFSEKLPAAFDKAINRAVAFAPSIMKALVEVRSMIGRAIGIDLVDEQHLIWPRITGIITGAVNSVKQAFIDAGQTVGAFVGVDLDNVAAGWRTWGAIVVKVFDMVKGAVSGVVDAVQTAIPIAVGVLQQIIPIAVAVGRGFIDNIAKTINWLVSDVVPPMLDIFGQTASFFLNTLQPAIQTTTQVFRSIFGDTLLWLASDVWPLLTTIARDTVDFWLTTLLPAIQKVAIPIRTVLGESIAWVADVAWPLFLDAAEIAVNYFSTTIAPMLPSIAKSIRDTLGSAMVWVAEVGWPAFLGAAKTVSAWIMGPGIDAFRSLVDWIGPKVSAVIKWVYETGWPTMLEWGQKISTWINQTAVPAITDLVSWLGPKISDVITWVYDVGWPTFLTAAEKVSTWINETAIPALTPLVEWIGVKLKDAATWVYETGWPMFVEAATKVSDWIRDEAVPRFTEMWSWLEEKTRPAITWITETGWPGMIEIGGKVSTMFSDMLGFIRDVWEKMSQTDIWDNLKKAASELWEAGKILVEVFWPDMAKGLGDTNPLLDAFVQTARVGAGFVLAFATGVKTLAEGLKAIKDATDVLPEWMVKGLWQAGGMLVPGGAAAAAAGTIVGGAANPPSSTGTPTGLANTGVAGQWGELIKQASGAQNVPAAVIAAIMEIESSGNRDAQSPMNFDRNGKPIGRAQGLMQVMPFHFGSTLGPGGELSAAERSRVQDPITNIMKGAEILAKEFKTFGSWEQAAAAYFGAIDRSTGQITGGTDVTGTSGNKYVALFTAAMNRYKEGVISMGNIENAAQDTAHAMPQASAAVKEAERIIAEAGQGIQDTAGQTSDVVDSANRDTSRSMIGLSETFTATSASAVESTRGMVQSVSQDTAAMAASVADSGVKMKETLTAAVAGMAGSTVTISRDMSGTLFTTIRDANGKIVEQYHSLVTDIAGQQADLARVSAMTGGAIAAGAAGINTATQAVAGLGNATAQAGVQIRQFNKDAGGIIPGYAGDPQWLADHGFIPPPGAAGTFNPQKRAAGGHVNAGQPYWVGEMGPELYYPSSPGTIMPNGRASQMQSHRVDVYLEGHIMRTIYITGRDVAIDEGIIPAGTQ